MADVRRLPLPVTDIWDWQIRAACRDIDSALFFHPENERGPAKAARDLYAKRICNNCPVIEECRRHALTVQEPYGVWGGLTVAERAAILTGWKVLLDVTGFAPDSATVWHDVDHLTESRSIT